MKTKALTGWIFLLFSFYAPAQQKLTVALEGAPLEDLFAAIEQQTVYRIYCNPAETDSQTVSVRCTDEEATEVLHRALQETSLKVSAFGKALFIAEGRELLTSLPPGYYHREDTAESAGASLIDNLLISSRRDRKASSENKIYEIGNASDRPPATGKVTVSGIVTSFRTGEPMTGIALFIREPVLTGTTTDAFGFYSIQLPAGRQELHIQGIGMKDSKRQLQIYSGGKLDIELEEQVYSLKEITVSSERVARVRTTTIGMERLTMKDMKNVPTAFGETDVMKIVLSLPGVKSVGEASGGIHVRGGATDQNLILFNDGTIYNPTHLFGFFSAFNPDVVKDMELYKSSIPSKYGGRLSSVLDINTREGNKKEFTGSASLGLLTSRLSLEGPLVSDKTSYLVGGRTTYSDWILKQLPENSGYKEGNAGFYDANLSLSHRFDEQNNLYLNGYFSRDRFRFNAREQYAYRNANGSVKWRRMFTDILTGVFTAGYDHYDFSTQNTDNPAEAYVYAFDINQGFGKADFSWYAGDKHTVDFGFSGLYYDLNPGSYLPEGSQSLVEPNRMQREKAFEAAVYAGDRWDITSRLSLNIGLRYSLFGALGPRTYNTYEEGVLPSLSTLVATETGSGLFRTYQGLEYRLSARYAFTGDLSVKAGINSMQQYIHKLSNTTVMSPTDTWKLSDANIRPQSGIQIAAGVYKNFAGHTIETSVETYYKTMKDYLDYRKGAGLLMNSHIETDIFPVRGRAYGVELMVRKTQGKLNGWASYTYSRTQLQQSDPRIPDPVNEGNWYPADFDKPHDFKLAGNYKFTHRFSVSMNCDYSTGRPVTLPVSKYRVAGGEFVYYSSRNQYRIPDFFRIDLSMNIEPSHHLTLLTHSSFSLGVYNVTGRKNAYSVYYIAEEGELQGYRLAIFGMPIPYISYNIKF
jgi:outer membrane cobalamin receptor